MTMKTLREQQRAARVALVASLLEQAGSVRRAARLGDLAPATVRRLRRAGTKVSSLTESAPPATK